MTGAAIYGWAYPSIFPTISAILNVGTTILPALLNVDLWLTVLFFALVSLTLFYFLEKHGNLRRDKVNS